MTVILNNPEKWGKGYALAGGVAHLQTEPPDIVVVVDADCTVSNEAIEHLASVVSETGLPVQSRYLILPNKGTGMALAWPQRAAWFGAVQKKICI